MAGGLTGQMEEAATRAFAVLGSRKSELGLAQDVDISDFHLQVNRPARQLRRGRPVFVVCCSALCRNCVAAGLLVLGDMTVQGNIKPVRSLAEPLRVAMDNGAKRALIPIENKRNLLDVSAEILEHVDSIFYGDPKAAVMKVLGGM